MRQLERQADEKTTTAELELLSQERSGLIAELATVEPELARQLGVET